MRAGQHQKMRFDAPIKQEAEVELLERVGCKRREIKICTK